MSKRDDGMDLKLPDPDITIRATFDQLEAFRGSPVWQAISNELQVWILQNMAILEGHDNVRELMRAQGRVEALKNVLTIIETLGNLKHDQEDRHER